MKITFPQKKFATNSNKYSRLCNKNLQVLFSQKAIEELKLF